MTNIANTTGTPVPVVAIGASAGGLAAIRAFVSAIPARSGNAYVVIQHLGEEHKSALAELANKWGTVRAVTATPGLKLEADTLYVIPGGVYAALEQGFFRFQSPNEPKGYQLPIDFFLRTLATECGEHAIAIIMSGTGSDGAQGLLLVKENGGLTLAEDPRVARFSSMPQAAIDIGQADIVCESQAMPQTIIEFQQQSSRVLPNQLAGESLENVVDDIIVTVNQCADNDFTGYKRTTIKRRIERRMGLRGLADHRDYLTLLQRDSDEANRLANDLLIGVTRFFRDGEAYSIIRDTVVPELFRGKEKDDPVRIWVAGCSTGEEAYSLTLLLFDYRDQHLLHNPIQVFASDIDTAALNIARSGLYGENAIKRIPQALAERYFTPENSNFRIQKHVRESMVFAAHNIISDPPFSRMDLVTCRNLLIYLDQSVQQRLMDLFAQVILPGGYLFLGSSETLGQHSSLFETISKPWRIYRSRVSHADSGESTLRPVRTLGASLPDTDSYPVPAARTTERSLRHLVEQHGPACLLINLDNNILYSTGNLADYVTLPRGEPNYDMYAMLHPALRSGVRPLISQALSLRQRVVMNGLRYDENRFVRVSATPISKNKQDQWLLLCIDEEAEQQVQAHPVREDESWIVVQLEQELQATREDLQRTIERLRTSNEELRAINEEFVAMNEELQSTNEELESSKEELQSLNEELQTSNSLLDAKVLELEAINDDLNNLFSSTDIATLFLDLDFNLKRFTPATTRLMRLIPSDIGRPITDIAHDLRPPELLDGAQQVLSTLDPYQAEIQDVHGRQYIKRILPYRKDSGPVVGLVITLSDVTALHKASSDIASMNNQLLASTAQLKHLEYHDALTGLPNHALLRDRIDQCIRQRKRSRKPLALLFMDLDRFKNINDTLGHDIGNALLAQVAERLCRAASEPLTVSRFGGDEFAILMEDADALHASHLAGEILTAVRTPFLVNGHELYTDISIGCALFPGDAQDSDSLIRCADAALNLAKHEGRGQYAFFTPELNRKAHRQLAIENRLRRAIANHELTLVYQPQVDIRNGSIMSAEALLRWHNPDLGQVSPGEFIPIAEESPLIIELGEWVLDEVCRQLQQWHTHQQPMIIVSLNISPLQLRHPEFIQRLRARLQDCDFAPQLLELELTERVLVHDPQQAIEVVAGLQKLGVKLSFDDFGTGFCSLQYLRHLRLNHLKVAREFIPADEKDIDNIEISRLIVSLAHTLKLECTVEGIETPAQLTYFREAGCDRVQGFYFSKPVAVQTLESWLQLGTRLPENETD